MLCTWRGVCPTPVPEADPVLHGAAGFHGLELSQDSRMATIGHTVEPDQGSLRETHTKTRAWFGFGFAVTSAWLLGSYSIKYAG